MKLPFLSLLHLAILVSSAFSSPQASQWAAQTFSDAGSQSVQSLPSLTVLRQDYGTLTFNRSVIDKPLLIGSTHFTHGLGTHANSEIVLHLRPAQATAFHAQIGINNDNGSNGSAIFSIKIAGKEVFKSPIRRGQDAPISADITIPPDTDAITLKVSDAGDGPAYDQSDWADAKLTLADGSELYLDSIPPPSFWPSTAIPFSFIYNGKPSSQLLPKWQKHIDNDQIEWLDPDTKLKVIAQPRTFDDFGAVEWLLRFENTGKADSPILENVHVLDTSLPLAPGTSQNPILDQINGDDASPNSFAPVSRPILPNQTIPLAPGGGRPSNGTFPFFAIENGTEHLFIAIGWTGQWAASISRDSQGLHLTAGMELTHLRLHPGESIRTPRILLMPARGDHVDAHNKFRRLLLSHYIPHINGNLPKFAVAAQSFDIVFFAGGRREWATEAGQIAAAKIEKQLGCDTHWFDAGWFEGDFPGGVGNWTVKPKEFPRGLKPVGDACHQLGLRFLVWYEPERVAANTKIAREHPEFVLSAGQPKINGGLFNLSDPAAAEWLTHLIITQMDAAGIDQYRNDFNMDPLGFWRANDPTDRQGITEIRYVENFYKMIDAIRAARPKLLPDDCASGGRRIDLEMVMRSVVQTRSDSAVAPDRADWHQCQTYGLSQFLPLNATICWGTDSYITRSAGAAGICMEWDLLDPKFSIENGRQAIEEIKANQKFWQGNFYPMTPYSFDANVWFGWQLDRPDLHEGIALVFRRNECPYTAMQLSFHALDLKANYHVELIDDQRHVENRSMSGLDLSKMELKLPRPKSSMLIRYRMI